MRYGAGMPRLPPLSSLRDLLGASAAFALVGVLMLLGAYWALDPSPPRHVVLATGLPREAYAQFGERYAAFLQAHGISVTLRATRGAAENLALLRDPHSGVDIAFVQGGADSLEDAAQPQHDEGLSELGSLFREPIWLFYRSDSAQRLLPKKDTLTRLHQLSGWRLNVGEEGSGVPPLMNALFEANGMSANAAMLSHLALTPAVMALLAGELDAMVIASAPESSMVQMLLQTPGIQLFNVAQAEAYARRFPFISPVTLPRGVVNLATDLPPEDVHLIAPTATLLARDSLHPALVQLFMQAASQIHGEAGWFQHRGEFPTAGQSAWPLAAEAQRFYRSGVPVMQRYLPFWLANLIDRMWVVLLSIVAVLIPLSRVLPPLVEMRIRSRVFRWYAQLREVEEGRDSRPAQESLAELDRIDDHVGRVRVPLSYADELYALRSHIQLVRRRITSPG
jgi:TRAP-type uncharacterized transport system substrate-binding protein